MQIYYSIFFFLIGCVLASFYGVVATRFSEGKSITGRSKCNHCQHTLSWKELIPIVSFLIEKGRCRYCNKPLPVYEPIIELISGCCFSFAYLHYGFCYELWVFLLLISLAELIFISDFRYMIILDSPLLFSALFLFVLKWISFGFSEALWSLVDGLALFLIFLFIGYIGSILFKREALGGGDIKLAFVMGEALSIPYALMALVLSTFLALPYATFSLFSSEEREVPFGPFLVSALCIVFLFIDKFETILNLFSF